MQQYQMPVLPPGGQALSPAKKRGSWVRQVEHWAIRVFSIIFSAVTAHAMWWFFSSALNWLDTYQWVVTLAMAVGFAGLGYIISRGLSHRLQRNEQLGVVLLIALVFEVMEVGACFAQAAVSIDHIGWLTTFHGGMYHILVALCYILLPITPFFTIALAWFDMDLDRQETGEKVPVAAHAKKATQPAAALPSFGPGGLSGLGGSTSLGANAQPRASYPSMQNGFFGAGRSQAVPQPQQSTMAMPGSAMPGPR